MTRKIVLIVCSCAALAALGAVDKVPAPSTRVLSEWSRITESKESVTAHFSRGRDTDYASFLKPNGVRLPVDFMNTDIVRAVWDVKKISFDLSAYAGVAFDFFCSDLASFSSFSLYFKSGDGYYHTSFAPDESGKWQQIRVYKSSAIAEGKPAGWDKVSELRICAWRNGDGKADCAIANLASVEKEPQRGTLSPEERQWFSALPSKDGEFRAFWCHQAYGIGSGKNWDESIRFLKENGFNAVLPNLAWGASAVYKSNVLPVSADVATKGDAFDECLAACRKYGVECHVWKVCWNMWWNAPKDFVQKMIDEKRVQVSKTGQVQDHWLCPSHPENKKLEIEAMVELAKKRPDGIHFDYIRYQNDKFCFCSGCHERFEKKYGIKVANLAEAIDKDEKLKAKWNEFRRSNINHVVRTVARRVRKEAPGVEISAAVFHNPVTDPNTIAQDWSRWCRKGWLDFVCPMDYMPSTGIFKSVIERQKPFVGSARFYPGIGLCAWQDRLSDAERVAKQILAVREAGLKGYTIFNFDWRAMDVMPLLKLGVTK